MADADFNVIDAVTDDCAVDTMDAMDVEPAQSLEGKPVDTVKPDQSWMQRRPFDDRHEDFDNDTPVPGSNSVKVESEDEVKPAKEFEDEAYLFLNKVWTNLQAINSNAFAKVKVDTRVRMGGMSMRHIDAEGNVDKVPTRTRASSSLDASHSRGSMSPEQQNEQDGLMLYLATTVVNLAERVNTLEDLVSKDTTIAASRPIHGSSASASQPKEDTLAATAATCIWHNKRKSAPEYKAPRFALWQLDSGKCRRCKHYWASDESQDHFMVMSAVWTTAMNKMFVDFRMDTEWFDVKEGYAHTESNVSQSLVSSDAIPQDEAECVATSFRRMLWKPDIANDARPMFLYRGGGKSRYITSGCILCQRATSLYYPSPSFMADLKICFP